MISRSTTAIDSKVAQLSARGKHDEALQCWKDEVGKREKTMGPTHDFTITGIQSIAELFLGREMFDEALEWYELVLKRTESSPHHSGDDDGDVLRAVENVATTLDSMDRNGEALVAFNRVLAGKEKERRKVRGRENLETLSIVSNIGRLHAALGNLEEGLEWLGRALSGFEAHKLGKEHHSMMTVHFNMARTLKTMGKGDEALQHFIRVVLADDGKPGWRTVYILSAMTNSAELLEQGFKHDEALVFYKRALMRYEALPEFGKNHPATLDVVNSMGSILDSQDKFQEGLLCYKRVVAAGLPGEYGFTTLTAVHGMASVLRGAGDYKGSLSCYEIAVDGHEKMFGKEHPLTLLVVSNMATLYYMDKNYEEALKLCRHVVDAGKGDEMILAKAANTMAMAYEGQGKDEEALVWYQRALAGFQGDGEDNIASLQTVRCIGILLCRQGKYEESLKYFKRALVGFELIGKEYRFTFTTVYDIGNLFNKQKLYEEAVEHYSRALAGLEKILGKRHKETLDIIRVMTPCYDNLGALCHKEEKLDRALGWYGRALASKERILPKGHPDILDTVSIMATIFGEQGRHKAALDFHLRALKGREKELGNNHPSTLESALRVTETQRHLGE